MPLVTVRALVLQAMPYSETSKILRLYTDELGLRSVMAKGAMRPKSRYGGLLEPFTEGVATFFLREGRDLFTLSGFDLVRARQGLGRSLVGFAGASVLAELALRAGTEEAHPEVLETLVESLDAIVVGADDPARESAAIAGAWRLVSVLGFEPELGVCVQCGRDLPRDEPTRFDAAAGGAICVRCRVTGRVLDPDTRHEVRTMIAGSPHGTLASPRTHRALLSAFILAQITPDRPLKSLDLFLRGGEVAAEPDA